MGFDFASFGPGDGLNRYHDWLPYVLQALLGNIFFLNSSESPLDLLYAPPQQQNRHDRPRRVHAGIVPPVVNPLRPAVLQASVLFDVVTRPIVEGNAVQMAYADHHLGDVAEGVLVCGDEVDCEEG